MGTKTWMGLEKPMTFFLYHLSHVGPFVLLNFDVRNHLFGFFHLDRFVKTTATPGIHLSNCPALQEKLLRLSILENGNLSHHLNSKVSFCLCFPLSIYLHTEVVHVWAKKNQKIKMSHDFSKTSIAKVINFLFLFNTHRWPRVWTSFPTSLAECTHLIFGLYQRCVDLYFSLLSIANSPYLH